MFQLYANIDNYTPAAQRVIVDLLSNYTQKVTAGKQDDLQQFFGNKYYDNAVDELLGIGNFDTSKIDEEIEKINKLDKVTREKQPVLEQKYNRFINEINSLVANKQITVYQANDLLMQYGDYLENLYFDGGVGLEEANRRITNIENGIQKQLFGE
jgi:hypothetical protein